MMASWRNLLTAFVIACWSGGILPARAEPESFADLVSRVLPTVVSISIKGTGESTAMMRGGAKNVVSAVPHIMEIVGSGCIIDPSGIIVTNRHVVDGAYEIQITLEDHTTVNARLLGKGLSFDIAVLKIDVDHPLPAIQVGDSDKVRIGDRVLAIGNPLGLSGTVTSGIVSGLRRDLRGTPYDEFIQTDASINPGNSGGPLFNMKGEVIGITNQIFSDTPTSGSIGLGFAIPSNDVQFLLEQIREHGRPRLGWLGLIVQTLTPDMLNSSSLPMSSGVIVADVEPDSPAAKAGVQEGDVIQAYDNISLRDYRQLNRAATLAVGKSMTLQIWRRGTQGAAVVPVIEWPQELWESNRSQKVKPPRFSTLEDFGMKLADVSVEMQKKFPNSLFAHGPIVTSVTHDSAASAAKLGPGDIILKVQMDDVHTVAELEEHLMKLRDRGERNALILVKGEVGKRWSTLLLQL